ncbi:MAG: manganese-dependent inorganic pyrophosphatase [Desulfovibrionaceae bacterium]|nr:manganese-dependent inorganic pyrophosphatase [Desulfovibrionaceae bacterium]
MAIIVCGHKNPDTDSIAAAIAIADLLTKRGMAAKPVAQGAVNPESKFVLDKFGLPAPEIVTDASGQKIALVDHSDLAQSLDNLAKGEIVGIYDHHKLGDVTTPNPLEMWVWPVGCTGTVINSMYKFYGIEIPKNIAGITLCSILSDTVMYKSVTCTEADKKAVAELAKIAGVSDVMALGMEMFKVKSAVEGTPMRDLVFRDYKDFDMSGKKVGIGQLEVVDLAILEPYKDKLLAEIKKVKEEGKRHSVFLLLTDIMKEGSLMLIASDDPSVVEKAYGKAPDGPTIWLDGVMSRKKQVVPNFEKAFGK